MTNNERLIVIESNWDIRFNKITDIDTIEKIAIQINEEIYSILTDPKTELSKVREIVNNILKWVLDYE
jgi:hypothetical protein